MKQRQEERGAIPGEVVLWALCLQLVGVAMAAMAMGPLGVSPLIALIAFPLAWVVLVAAVGVCLLGADTVARIRARRAWDERGAVTAMVVMLGLAMMVVAGLVIDGGYALGERRQAMNQAEQAARAGSDALGEGSLRDGTVRVDPGRAVAAANAYLARVGAHGRVSVNGEEVTVTVTSRQETVILSLVGVGSLPVEATASAVSIGEND